MNQSRANALFLFGNASGAVMTRNGLYAVIAILMVAIVGFGIYSYQQQQAQPGLEVRVDGQGISIDGKG